MPRVFKNSFTQPLSRDLLKSHIMALKNPRFSSCTELRAASENSPPLKAGDKGEGVAIVQQALIDLGFSMPISTDRNSKLPDGIYGRETVAKVKDFQRANGLQVDGEVGRQTLGKLEELIASTHSHEAAIFRTEVRHAKFFG
jgi:peptidoglycan hydrolase-like protein with peptidoglycan-binding domain